VFASFALQKANPAEFEKLRDLGYEAALRATALDGKSADAWARQGFSLGQKKEFGQALVAFTTVSPGCLSPRCEADADSLMLLVAQAQKHCADKDKYRVQLDWCQQRLAAADEPRVGAGAGAGAGGAGAGAGARGPADDEGDEGDSDEGDASDAE
jgi:hypothetical protein